MATATMETTKQATVKREDVEGLDTDLYDQEPAETNYCVSDVTVQGQEVTLRGWVERLYWTRDYLMPEGEPVAVLDHTRPLYAVAVTIKAQPDECFPEADWWWEMRAEVAKKSGAEAVTLAPDWKLTVEE